MEKSFPVTEKVMDMINRYTIDPLKPEDVFCFSLTLCDNDIDRDNERFSDRALSELAKLPPHRGRPPVSFPPPLLPMIPA